MFNKNEFVEVERNSKRHAGRFGYFQQMIPNTNKAVISTKRDNIGYETFSVDKKYLRISIEDLTLSKKEWAEKFTTEVTTFDGKVKMPGRFISAKKIIKNNYTIKPIKEEEGKYLVAVFKGDKCIGRTTFIWKKYFTWFAGEVK
jgi:hypothetical protein